MHLDAIDIRAELFAIRECRASIAELRRIQLRIMVAQGASDYVDTLVGTELDDVISDLEACATAAEVAIELAENARDCGYPDDGRPEGGIWPMMSARI